MKTRIWIMLLLVLFFVILVIWNFSKNINFIVQTPKNHQEPTYTTKYSNTMVYNSTGGLSYYLVSDQVTYSSSEEITWFDNPIMTFYNEKNPNWLIRSDKAKINKNNILYLYGHVEVKSLVKDAKLRQIKADDIQINLATKDVQSNSKITLYGQDFNTTGMKMYGNLQTEIIQLIEKVKTCYEINIQ